MSLVTPLSRTRVPAAWGLPDALDALRSAAPSLPFAGTVDDAVCVQVVSTAVFRVGDLAVKVYPPGRRRGAARRCASGPACRG